VFYVQVTEQGATVTLRLEKTQVGALAQYLAELLADLPPVDDGDIPTDVELEAPVVPEWVVGGIGVAFDEGRDRMLVTFQEIVPEDAPAGTAGSVSLLATRAQCLAFVRRAAELLSAGRPPCPLCGRPLDPEGHTCIKTNGHHPH
jgi:uncharacterized repeat protein (TIGR03847 family)